MEIFNYNSVFSLSTVSFKKSHNLAGLHSRFLHSSFKKYKYSQPHFYYTLLYGPHIHCSSVPFSFCLFALRAALKVIYFYFFLLCFINMCFINMHKPKHTGLKEHKWPLCKNCEYHKIPDQLECWN